MLVVWVVTAILQSLNVQAAIELWHWFGEHVLITLLLIILLA